MCTNRFYKQKHMLLLDLEFSFDDKASYNKMDFLRDCLQSVCIFLSLTTIIYVCLHIF